MCLHTSIPVFQLGQITLELKLMFSFKKKEKFQSSGIMVAITKEVVYYKIKQQLFFLNKWINLFIFVH